jgi:hypothetical protein
MVYNEKRRKPSLQPRVLFPTRWIWRLSGIALTSYANRATWARAAFLVFAVKTCQQATRDAPTGPFLVLIQETAPVSPVVFVSKLLVAEVRPVPNCQEVSANETHI